MASSPPPPPPRFPTCNGAAIRALRLARGWTQRELADKAGYSLRWVQKAEAGGALAPGSLGVLAQALATGDAPVTVEDLTATPLSVVKEFVELINRRHAETADAARHLMAEDFVLWCAGNKDQMPFAGEWRGHEGAAEFFRLFFSVLTPAPEGLVRDPRFLANGREVVCWFEAHAKVESMPGPAPAVWVWHRYEVREGRIARYENHFDTLTGAKHLAEARARSLLTDSGV